MTNEMRGKLLAHRDEIQRHLLELSKELAYERLISRAPDVPASKCCDICSTTLSGNWPERKSTKRNEVPSAGAPEDRLALKHAGSEPQRGDSSAAQGRGSSLRLRRTFSGACRARPGPRR